MISVSKERDIWRVTLNRPEKANALTAPMLDELIKIMNAADGQAKILVLTGNGRVFSAGADLDEAHGGLATSPLWEQLSGAVEALPCLTIAALNGTIAGGAFGMALACDLRLAVPDSKFFYPVVKHGFLPQPSDAKRMVNLIGPARAKIILMAGQKIAATEALNWGLIDRIVPTEKMDDAISELSAITIDAELNHIGAIKSMIVGPR